MGACACTPAKLYTKRRYLAKSRLETDESTVYTKIGEEFAGHGVVNHSIKEYVRGGFWHTNTVENYFSILKRGINGVYQHVSQKHLKRYIGEFDFRYNERGITDAERAAIALKGITGKRLTYRRLIQGRDAVKRYTRGEWRAKILLVRWLEWVKDSQ